MKALIRKHQYHGLARLAVQSILRGPQANDDRVIAKVERLALYLWPQSSLDGGVKSGNRGGVA